MTDRIENALRQRSAVNGAASTSQPRSALEMSPSTARNAYGGHFPNTPLTASTISFILGSVFSLGFALFISGGISSTWWGTYQLGFFVAAWAAFHYGEFAVTAGWNRDRCSVDSFLLDNGTMYHVANGTALVEYLITLYFLPEWKTWPYISSIGVLLTIGGQTLRSAAMIKASTNFSHQVAFQKAESHQLVTDGVYAWFRHPSYAGFFYWALGTQLTLQNPVSFLGFSFVLWRFFHDRTKSEERALIRFFGDEYIQYRKRVGTKIPFVQGYTGQS